MIVALSARARRVGFACATLFLCLLAPVLTPALANAQPATEVITARLSQYAPVSGPLRLTDVSNSMDLFVPQASTVAVTDAVVDLRFSHSIALQPERSYLVVRFNEATLAQVPFDPAQPLARARVRLAAELWRPGFNKLTIGVIQHYGAVCEDPEAPELWTEVDLHASTLTVTLAEHDAPLTLSDLSGVFSPGLGGVDRVVMATASPTGGQAADALPLVAQALALRRQFAPLAVDHAAFVTAMSPDLAAALESQPGNDPGASYLGDQHAGMTHVLVGTRDELAAVLSPAELERIDGPHLALTRLPGVRNEDGEIVVPSALRLLVAGPTAEEVMIAAHTLAEMDDALNPIDRITVLGRDIGDPSLAPVHGRVLHGGRSYTFEALGSPTATMEANGSHRMRVNLPMPGDFYTTESAKAELFLDFGYGAGMGPGSVMNVLLNGEFIHGLLFDSRGGTAFRDYRIALPARRLQPGINTLDFDITLRPETVEGECAGIKGRHLIAQFLGTSTVSLPQAGAAATQPNLRLFSTTGFPYVTPHRPAAGGLAVADAAHLGAALSLVGKIAQVAGAPQYGWRVQVGLEPADMTGPTLVLATPEQMPPDLFDAWSISLGRTVRWPYRMLNDLRLASEQPRSELLSAVLGSPGAPSDEARLRGTVTQDAGLGPLGAMAAFRNPYGTETATMTVVTAATPSLLDARVNDLIRPEVWGQIAGDMTVWQGIDDPVTSLKVADNFEVGGVDRWLLLRLVLSNNPWYWLAGVMASTLALAWSARLLLRRRRARLEMEGG